MQVWAGNLDDSTPVCFAVTRISSTMFQKCPAQVKYSRELPFCFVVWHVPLLNSNYECNYATCFWPDVIWFQTFAVFWMSYAFFWVISRRLDSDAGELPRRKHTTDVIWNTNYNRRKGRLLSCRTLSRQFFDLFLQLRLNFLLFCLFLLFLFLLLFLLTMKRIRITFGHFTGLLVYFCF
jgi:hypothetical protein